MNFLFFWRLSREKGFDLIVEALSRMVERPEGLPGNFCIFGEGDLQKQLFETFEGNPLFEDCLGWDMERINIFRLTPNPSPSEERGDSNKIFFFGWQSKATIESMLWVSHFSLMPSRFLETFGLSALESLAEGVPVIGFRKWWLVPFIAEELAIPFSEDDRENIEALVNKILEVSGKYSEESTSLTLSPRVEDPLWRERGLLSSPLLLQKEKGLGDEAENMKIFWKSLSNASRRIADGYTEDRWMQQVRDMLPKHAKKILLATDYVTLLGGIETHVQTIAHALRRHGYEVEVFGWSLPKGKWTRILRLMGLVYSLCNITSALGMRKKIREFEPDVVWLHSVSRFLGPLTVREVVKWSRKKGLSELSEVCHPERQSRDLFRSALWHYIQRNFRACFLYPKELVSNEACKRDSSTSVGMTKTPIPLPLSNYSLVTYHDLGLWSPFPSQVESEDMVPKSPSLGAFLGVVDSKNPIVYLAAYCKYFQIFILRKLLKNIDIHIVPSAFLSRYVRDISEVPEERAVVLEHFL